MLFGRYLHGVQEPRDGVRVNSFAIHLLDGGDGAQLTLVVDGFAADPPFAVGIPFVVADVGLTQGGMLYFSSRSRMCVFEHANSRAISRMESRSTRYFCLSTPSGIWREVMQIVGLIDICGMSTDSQHHGCCSPLRYQPPMPRSTQETGGVICQMVVQDS